MKLVVIETTWGGLLVHSDTCPIIERDWNMHGNTQLDVETDHKWSLVRDVREALEVTQDEVIYSKRFIYHSLTENKVDVCTAQFLPQ